MSIEYYLSNSENTTAIVKCKASLGLSTTLEYSVNSDFTSSTITSAVTPLSTNNFIATFNLTGLAAGTQYYFRAIEDSVTDNSSGKLRTMQPEGVPQNIKFAFSGDADSTNNSQSFANVAALTDIDFYLCTGDLHYGDVATNTEAAYFTEYDGVLTQPNQKAMYQSHSLLYSWDDHDYGANDSNASSVSKTSAASAFRKMVPTNSLVNGSGSIESVTVYGRVKFILLDGRYERSGSTILGSTQLAWLLTQFEESKSNDNIALTVVSVGVPWISSSGADTWVDAAAERTTIANKIFSEGLEDQIAFICGDMHAITHDDGTNNTFDTFGQVGWPVFQSAPMGRTGSTKGGPYSGTVYVGDTDGQYSTMEILDDGLSIDVTVTGLDKNEATLYTYNFAVATVSATGFNLEVKPDLTVTDVVRISDTQITITLPVSSTYDIGVQETVTAILPDSVLVTATAQVIAAPTFTIDPILTNFDAEVRDKELVTSVVRTNDTTVTITLSAASGYDIDLQEIVTSTIPAEAMVLTNSDLEVTPAFTVEFSLAATITDINTDENIDDAETGIPLTVANFASDINSVKLISGTAETVLLNLSGTGNDYTFDNIDISAITSSTAGAPLTTASNVVQIEASDGTATELLTVTNNPKAGWAVQEITSADQTQGSVFENFVGTVPDASLVYYPTADSTSVSSTGVYASDNITTDTTMLYWDSVTELWESFTGITVAATDTTPDAFTFTDLVDQPLSTLTQSNAQTITGIDSPTNISVNIGEYNINGGVFTSSSTNLSTNDVVIVRQTSSAINSTATVQTVTIGGVVSNWSVTTEAAISITDQLFSSDGVPIVSETLDYFTMESFGGAVSDTGVLTTDASGNFTLFDQNVSAGSRWMGIKNQGSDDVSVIFPITVL